MNWHIKKFNELTTDELYSILRERVNVFVVEQNCPYPEIDGKDSQSYHLFVREKGKIIAYTRLLPAGISYSQASIGRVLVIEEYRNTGLGKKIMKRSIDYLHQELKENEIKIQAQEYALQFYESFGFKPVSKVYLEDDIPHVDMVWTETSR
ncbi:GNAT family N-acetyltransferase [Salipaludibacillus keqinensis]|uniref:GNAT family N-acetyltransferase n=1 Tax=Salipaludibacillus keqinensis TaxID=2045207 RepID=A0A323TBT3_9BACI|nr:GNAT family N-acetyltransferase [Salipaludibacillus keqinensis]PYZ92300.1 GNAT family N-acetyltransferase [Salipaludibacillus keqinensis]